MRFKGIGVMVLAAVSLVVAPAAMAQQAPREPIRDAFTRAFYRNGRDTFDDRTIVGQFNFIFGPGAIIRNSFPENVIARDSELIHEVYEDAYARQAFNGPTIRTVDLPNPFNTSVLTLPATAAGQTVPPLEIGAPPQPEPLQATPASPRRPVRALW